MVVKTIVCDRCNEQIKEEHPDRVEIQKYSKDMSTSYGRKYVGYKASQKLHLCDTCMQKFEKFLKREID